MGIETTRPVVIVGPVRPAGRNHQLMNAHVGDDPCALRRAAYCFRLASTSTSSSALHAGAPGNGIQDFMGLRATPKLGWARPGHDLSCCFMTAGSLGKRSPGEAQC